jgi:hypothetical protein
VENLLSSRRPQPTRFSFISKGFPLPVLRFKRNQTNTNRMKYSEVIHANKKFDEKTWAEDPKQYDGRHGQHRPAGGPEGVGGSIWQTLSTQDRARLLDFTTARSSTTGKVNP